MDLADLSVLGHDLLLTKRCYLAATAILFYDVLLTLPDQITYIWQAKKTFVSYLCLFNIYLACVFSIGMNIGWFLPSFPQEVCQTSAILQGIQASIVFTTAEAFMLLRIYALSRRNLFVLAAMLVYVVALTVFSLVCLGISGGKPGFVGPALPLDAYHICLLSPVNPIPDKIYQYMALTFDAIVFLATMTYTFKAIRSSGTSNLLRALVRDGTLYFLMIFTGNLAWILCVKHGRIGIKSLPIGPNLLVIPVMLNRLTLSLHKADRKDRGHFSTSDLFETTGAYGLTEYEQEVTMEGP